MRDSMAEYVEYENYMPFDLFARAVCAIPDEKSNRHFRSQNTFITDRHNRLIPHWIGRFERLHDDFRELCERVGISGIQLPQYKVTKRTTYHDYYTNELKDMVYKRYQRDVELFSYEF
jgi:hypothetical protein